MGIFFNENLLIDFSNVFFNCFVLTLFISNDWSIYETGRSIHPMLMIISDIYLILDYLVKKLFNARENDEWKFYWKNTTPLDPRCLQVDVIDISYPGGECFIPVEREYYYFLENYYATGFRVSSGRCNSTLHIQMENVSLLSGENTTNFFEKILRHWIQGFLK